MRAKRLRRRYVCGDDNSDDNSEIEDAKAGLSLKDRVCEELRDLQVFFCMSYIVLLCCFVLNFLNFNSNVCSCSGQPTAAQRPCKKFWTPSVMANLATSCGRALYYRRILNLVTENCKRWFVVCLVYVFFFCYFFLQMFFYFYSTTGWCKTCLPAWVCRRRMQWQSLGSR